MYSFKKNFIGTRSLIDCTLRRIVLIATQSNICAGKFRVTHGIPAFRWYRHWRSYDLKSYEYMCPTGIEFRKCDKGHNKCHVDNYISGRPTSRT